MDQASFVATYGGMADEIAANTHLSRWLHLAQFADETGWGDSPLCIGCHNLAGVNFVAESVGGATDSGGFACYPDLAGFVADYLRVIHLGFYANVLAQSAADLEAQCKALGESPWASGHYVGQGSYAYPGGTLVEIAQGMIAASQPAPTPAPQPAPAPPPPPPAPAPERPQQHAWYTVQSGNSLSEIGAECGVSWASIYKVNEPVIGANPNLIYAGQRLWIPAGVQPSQLYVVEPNDNLSVIAAKLGHPGQYMALFEANRGVPQPTGGPITNMDLIYAGQILTIPW